jgi:Zn-dependent peptidase ImmA (M78 family)
MNNSVVNLIVEALQDKLKSTGLERKYPNRVLRGDIVEILDDYCTVVYYPLKDDNNGFHRIVKSNGENIHFVFINTAQTIDKQVFTAAHELGHLWNIDKIVLDKLDEKTKNELGPDASENIINRFAAELMMPKVEFSTCFLAFLQDTKDCYPEISVLNLLKTIVHLMDRFLVPFKAVLWRLNELGYLSSEDTEYIKREYESKNGIIYPLVDQYIEQFGYRELNANFEKKYINGFAEILAEAERRNTLSPEKIKQLREAFCISSESLSDNELPSNKIVLKENAINGKDSSN